MLRGNISNMASPIVAFNIDNLLFDYVEVEKRKFLLFKEKNIERVLDRKMIVLMNAVWNTQLYSVYLITKEDYGEDFENELSAAELMYTRIHKYSSIEELRSRINLNYHLYVDSDYELMAAVHNPNVIHIDKLFNHIAPKWRRT